MLSKNNYIRNNIFISNKKNYILLFFCFCSIYFLIFSDKTKYNKDSNIPSNEIIPFEEFEIYKYNEIKQKLNDSKCSQMWANQREFLNGIVRKFKPKKIVEIGVASGGSSIILLNAIADSNNAKLYSIDLNPKNYIGFCVNKYFPQFMKNWNLFKGNFTTEYMEKIGNNIDMVLIDTAHFEPGEILDFLIVLPFLKEEAIVIFHDIANQITISSIGRNEWAPYIIFNAIRGEKYLPKGKYILKQDIGAIKLDKNQRQYHKDYFRLLGGQWQYFPKEIFIKLIFNYFKKYYDKECLIIFQEAVDFNRKFIKKNPMPAIYKINSD